MSTIIGCKCAKINTDRKGWDKQSLTQRKAFLAEVARCPCNKTIEGKSRA